MKGKMLRIKRQTKYIFVGALAAAVFAVCLGFILGALNGMSKESGRTGTSGEPHLFESTIRSAIHEIVQIENITSETTNGFTKVECGTIYSSKPDRLGNGTVYFFNSDVPKLAAGQVYLVCINMQGYTTVYVVSDYFLSKEGCFTISFSGTEFFELQAMNSTIEFYMNHPDERIPSIPKEPLQGKVTFREVETFFEAMKSAYQEWATAHN